MVDLLQCTRHARNVEAIDRFLAEYVRLSKAQLFGAWPRQLRAGSERVAVSLAGANAQRVIDRRHENLAVADLAGTGA
jgi:hypothetical protein